jgi:hypothetical protein
MSYNVYKTDGNLLTIVNDGAINSSTSLNLVGIGYNAYAESIAESLVHLMENFSSLTPPTSPIVGQLWWDAVNHRLNIYDGTVFKAINNINVSATAPVSDTFGDYWYDTVNNQLKFFTLTGWLVIAPAYTTNQGVSGQIVNTLTDTQGLSHTVTSLYNANNLIAAIVTEPFSTYNLPGLYTVKNGINLAAGYELNGTVSIARESLGLTANADVNYMHSNTNTSTIGIVTVNNDGGLVVGVTSPISLFYDSPSNNWNFTPTTSNLTIGGGGTSAVINVNQNGWVGINTLNPLYDLDVQDDIGLSGNIYLESTATTYPGLVWDYNSGVGLLNGTSLNLYNNKSSISLDASTNIITLSSMFINGNTATNDLFNSTSTVSANKILGFTVGNSSTALVGNTLAATNMTAMLLSATTVNAATIGNTGAVFNGDKIVVNTINAGLIGNSNSTQLQGTLITQAQGNITSLGLLTGLTSVGTIAAATMNAGVIGNTGAALRGATATLTGAVAANTYTGVAINAGTIGNAGAAIVGATVTTTGLISTTSTATASTMNAATLNATTINATQESVTTLNVGTVITSPLVNAATIGNSGAAIVGATSTMSGPSKAASYTATGGGQVSGYFTGIIGANVPNIAYFSTVYITSNQTTFGLVNAPTINAASIGNAGTAYTGSTLSLTNSVTAPTLTGTTVSGAAVTGATIGNSGSQLSGASATLTGTVSAPTVSGAAVTGATIGNSGSQLSGASATLTGTVSAPTVSGAAVTGATIGNSGSRLSGASATLTGTVSAPTVSGSTVTGATIGNTGAVFTGSSINLTGAVIASGTISAPTINAGTIGNSGATFTGATLTTTSDITTSGNVVVATAPTSGNHATNKTYVDAKVLSAQLPVGTVIMWYGSLGSLPTGYHLCDGTSGTPDLRDRFVYGAGGTVTIGATGGNNSISTTTASAGGHFHTASTTSTGIHSHSITINGVPAHTHDFYDVYGIDDDDGGGGSVGNYNIINGVPTYYPYNTASGLGLSPSALSNRPSAPTTILSDADGRPVQPSLYYRQGSPQGNGYEFFYQNGEGSTDPSFSTGQDHATFAFKNRTLSTGTGGGITSTTDAGGAHNHTSLTDTAAAHTHGVSFDNTPAWTALAYIMRIS